MVEGDGAPVNKESYPPDLEKLTVAQIFRSLTVGQAWGIAVAIVTILGATYAAGASSSSFWASILSPVPREDKAEVTLNHFLDALKTRNFREAFSLLHPDRIEQKRAQLNIPAWGLKDYEKLFDGTEGYANRTIEYVRSDGTDRLYRVTYDVFESVPRNELFALRKDTVSSRAFDGEINRQKMMDQIIENLRQYYLVPDDKIPAIRAYIGKKRFEDLIDTNFLAGMVGELALLLKFNFEQNPAHPDYQKVKRHFVHSEAQMRPVDGAWKVRQFDADLIAPYL